MALEDVREKADTTYYNYTPLDEPKDNVTTLKKGDFVEGYYYNSYQRKGAYGLDWNHVLIKEDGTHHVIPGSKDVDEMFLNETKKGLFTRYTYNGKNTFEYKTKNEKGEEITGKAKAIQGLIQQDKDRTCTFEGSKYAAKVILADSAPSSSETSTPDPVSIENQDVPF